MFSNPAKNLRSAHVGPGMKILDMGAGSGFYSIEAARLVGKEGKVYAADLQEDLLRRVKNEATREGLENLEVLHADVEKQNGIPLKDETLDLVIAANILFSVENKEALLAEAKRLLRTKGRILVVDWSDSFAGIGPHVSHVVSKEETLELLKKTGFTFDSEISAGEHHYGILARK